MICPIVTTDQSVPVISEQVGVDTGSTLEDNGLLEEDFTVYPFTTLLVPLQNPPSNQSRKVPPPPPSIPSSNNSSSKTWIYVVVGPLGGFSLTVVLGAIVFCLFFHKKKKHDSIVDSEVFKAHEKPNKTKAEEKLEKFFLEGIHNIAQYLKVYIFEKLQSATNNFSPSCCIKGSVFRGTINGDFAAIKKINGDVSHEINLISKINHFNLIRLSGVCFNDGNWYLVYEYVVNGPLGDWLYYMDGDQNFLNWIQRIQIVSDVASGLNYLHNYASPAYVHKDVKSSNVLLDVDFRAKITNFNLARSTDGK
ncbi:unnamed protein product [Ilex paraguariensis]|uniref:Protein kinase domain-containing protein n=1 Tax=Ilex paraguariensis TaxID=185542 RepID=A0ABC8SDJ1_9AQUA